MAKRGSNRRTVVTQLLLGAALLGGTNYLSLATALAPGRKRGQKPQARSVHLASRTRPERPRRHHRLGAEAAGLCLSQRDSDRRLDLLDRKEGFRDPDRGVHRLEKAEEHYSSEFDDAPCHTWSA